MRVKVVATPKWIQLAQCEARLFWSKKKHQHHFNGKIAAVVNILSKELEICWVEYCLRWAQDKMFLNNCLPISTLSVTAIVTWQNKYLVGLRSTNVSNYTQHWEFTPAGGVAPIADDPPRLCLQNQILLEWHEEVGENNQTIKTIKCLKKPIFIPSTQTWIVLYHIKTKPFRPSLTQETSAWRWLSKDQLMKELSGENRFFKWVPGSKTLFDQFCFEKMSS